MDRGSHDELRSIGSRIGTPRIQPRLSRCFASSSVMSEPQVRVAETRLLYENANTGVAITLVIAALLAYVQWDGSRVVVVAWLVYMTVVSVARFALARRY